MKVIFEFSKSLGNNLKDDKKEMFDSTAAVLERKGFGKITEKVISVKKKGEGFETKTAKLSDEDRKVLKLDESLIKKTTKTKED